MVIKLLEPWHNNISQYLECVSDLNSPKIKSNNVDDVRKILSRRPGNILTFVGVVDDTIVSTATMILEEKLRYSQCCCHIEDVGVHPNYRHKGYGSVIVQYCVDAAKQYNCYKIKLNCSDELLVFYTKLGFQVCDNHMYIKGEDL